MDVASRSSLLHGYCTTPEPRPDTQQISTFNGASVVEITTPAMLFCNQIAKALAHTVAGGVDDAAEKFKKFEADGTPPTEHRLLAQWGRILFRYATQGAPQFQFDRNTPPVALHADILAAMEIFVLGHECGHHIAQGVGLSTENMTEENLADIVGRSVLMAAAKVRRQPLNYFLISGAGATIALCAFEMLLRAKQVLRTGRDELAVSQTHPKLSSRLRTIDWAEPLIEFPALKHLHDAGGPDGKRFVDFRQSLEFILAVIWRTLEPSFVKFHQEGIRPAPDATDQLGRLGF